jgi:hypothetical protein
MGLDNAAHVGGRTYVRWRGAVGRSLGRVPRQRRIPVRMEPRPPALPSPGQQGPHVVGYSPCRWASTNADTSKVGRRHVEGSSLTSDLPNVIATGAMFVALGGGAYALSGAPDNSGVFHGCVSNRTGALRVVRRANSCTKAHGRGRHRNPGETAITWSQQGPRGLQGIQGMQGMQGQKGDLGMPGQNATKLFAYVDDFGPNSAAVVQYGSGVTGVTDPNGNNAYTVSFDRSLQNCVVDANRGLAIRRGTHRRSAMPRGRSR